MTRPPGQSGSWAAQSDAGAAQDDAGFTLIEVLVTLALLSVMAALMLVVASQFRTLVDRQADLSARQEAAAIVRYLADEISVARVLPMFGLEGAQMRYMTGGEASIHFAAVVRTGSASFGLRDVRFLLRTSEQTQLLEIRRLRRTPVVTQPEAEIVLAEAVEAFSLRYLPADPSAIDWTTDWDRGTELPRAVEISLSLKRNGRIVSTSRIAPTANGSLSHQFVTVD